MRVKLTITFTEELDIDPADYIDPANGEDFSIDTVCDGITEQVNDDPDSFVSGGSMSMDVKVENIP